MAHERTRFVESPRDRVEVVDSLVSLALSEIDAMHGPDSPEPKKYHARLHAEDVMDAAAAMVELAVAAGKLAASAKDIARLFAAYHDWEQGRGDENETISAGVLSGRMQASNVFNAREVKQARGMVMTTQVELRQGVLVHVRRPRTFLQSIAADADLAMLGRPPEIFWDRAHLLLIEHSGTDQPTRQQELEFARAEIPLLQSHRFYTEEANTLFPHREENLAFVQRYVTELEAA